MSIDLIVFHSVCRNFIASYLDPRDLCPTFTNSVSLSGQSTVDHEGMTRDECTRTTSQLYTQFPPASQWEALRIFTSQEQRRVRDILWLADGIPRMDSGHNGCTLIRRKLVGGHRALNASRSKAIDVNAISRVVNSHLLGHANDLSC
jgi:hypothetical protein